MAALAAFIGTLFTNALGGVGLYLVKRLAIIAAIIAAITAAVITFTNTMQGMLDQLAVSYPTGSIAIGLSLLPSNTDDCVAIVVSTYIFTWAHGWYVKILVVRAS